MESSANRSHPLVNASRRIAHQTMVVFDNRLQLFLLEVNEERDRIFLGFCLILGVAVFALLAGIALTALITVACWSWSPVGALSILTLFYIGMATTLYVLAVRLRRDWKSFSATANELRKDRECLKRLLS